MYAIIVSIENKFCNYISYSFTFYKISYKDMLITSVFISNDHHDDSWKADNHIFVEDYIIVNGNAASFLYFRSNREIQKVSICHGISCGTRVKLFLTHVFHNEILPALQWDSFLFR